MSNIYNQNKFDAGGFDEDLNGNGGQPNQGNNQNQMQQMYGNQNQGQMQNQMNQGGQQFPPYGQQQQYGGPPGGQFNPQQNMMMQQQMQQQQYPMNMNPMMNQMQGMNMGGPGPQMGYDPQMQQQMMMQNQQMQGQQFGGAPQQQQMQAPVQQAEPVQQAAPVKVATPAAPFEKSDFSNFGASKEFIPDNGKLFVTDEQFPDLDALADAKPIKKAKKGKGAPKPEPKKEEVEDNAWKGKPSTFFVMTKADGPGDDPAGNPENFTLGDDQWGFMYMYYPEYCAAPYTMVTWLFGQALAFENMYSKPKNGGIGVQAEQEDDDVAQLDFMNAGTKKKGNAQHSKEDVKNAARLAEEKRQQKIQDIKDERLKQGKAVKTVEVVKHRAYKDKVVEVDRSQLKEVDPKRAPCSLVFIGHVDAGKSTICGNLMLLNGVIDPRTVEKFKQEAKDKGRDSWWLAYVMDVSDEEKSKGKTVEVGRAQFDTATKKYTIFDAPGHKNYVPNMIMGAALADVAGLVISARKGEFEAGFEKDGQTREHAQLAKSLGVQKLLVIVNKMDDCKWSKNRFQEIKAGLTPFLNATGYADKDILWVPIAGLPGHNIKDALPKGVGSWYKGKTLMEILDGIELEKRFPDGPLRIPILDKMKDPALVCHGKVENGSIRLGDKLTVAPSGVPAQVLSLLDGRGEEVEYAGPGENVQIKINVADDEQIQRGFVLCPRDNMMPVTDVFEAEIDILELLEYKPIVTKGYTCIMHIHTFADEVVIKDIVRSYEKNDRGEVTEKHKPQFARSQTKIIARVAPKTPIALEKFETIQQMGRFTLRDEGKTICVGKVLKYKPYTKGAIAGATEAQKAAQTVTATTGQAEELVYDMETGEMRPKKQELAGIAEGDEDDQDN